jgi:membrane protease YdiL (CAAX protease family)
MATASEWLVLERSRSGAVWLVGAALGAAVGFSQYWPAVLACVAVVGSCLALRDGRRLYLPLFLVVASVLLRLPWPFPATLAILALALVRSLAGPRRSAGLDGGLWRPKWDRTSALLIALTATVVGAICAVIAPLALAGNYMYVDSPAPPWWQIAALVALFAIVNAATEEIVWRGILWSSAAKAGLRPVCVVVLTSASFGLSHLHGLPGGWGGIVVATVFGAALGWLRHRTSSLLAPFVVHLVADLVLFSSYASFLVFRRGPGC